MLTQNRSKRKPTGGKYKKGRDKRLYEIANEANHPRIGKNQVKGVRTTGGNSKTILLNSDIANVLDPKTKTYKKSKIKTVADNPASKHFIRRNILTKGTVIETELGKAKITNRPGQEGAINAVLM